MHKLVTIPRRRDPSPGDRQLVPELHEVPLRAVAFAARRRERLAQGRDLGVPRPQQPPYFPVEGVHLGLRPRLPAGFLGLVGRAVGLADALRRGELGARRVPRGDSGVPLPLRAPRRLAGRRRVARGIARSLCILFGTIMTWKIAS